MSFWKNLFRVAATVAIPVVAPAFAGSLAKLTGIQGLASTAGDIAAGAGLGALAARATGGDWRTGALIGSVVPAGPAAKSGLLPGDIITEAGGAVIVDAGFAVICSRPPYVFTSDGAQRNPLGWGLGSAFFGWTKQSAEIVAFTAIWVPGSPRRMVMVPTFARSVDGGGSAAQPVFAHFSPIVKLRFPLPYVAPA